MVDSSGRVLGVGVVGLGVGEQHARAYLLTERCRLRWLYDLDERRATDMAIALGQGSPADSFDTLLTDLGTDLVSIASYDDAHFEQVTAALRAGKHVFVEKPLCRSMGELVAIKQAWVSSGYPHLRSNLVLRAAPLYQWLKHAIELGTLGDLYAFDGDYLYGRLHKITEGWRKDVDGYSVMQGGGIHLVDLLLLLTGEKPNVVTAIGNHRCTTGTAFRYDDYVSATFQFASTLVGRITANFGCVHAHQHVVRIFGTKGTFIYDDRGARLHLSRDPEVPAAALDLSPSPASKGVLIPDFVQAIADESDTRAQTQHEFDVVAACLAADRALADGTTTQVEYV